MSYSANGWSNFRLDIFRNKFRAGFYGLQHKGQQTGSFSILCYSFGAFTNEKINLECLRIHSVFKEKDRSNL